MSELSSFELGWLCGILEGEGCFDLHRNQRITVGMTDEDVIYKVAALFERVTKSPCNVNLQYPQKMHHSVCYKAQLDGEKAKIVMRLVVKYMSSRRRQKIWQCLNHYAPKNVKLDLVQLNLVKRA